MRVGSLFSPSILLLSVQLFLGISTGATAFSFTEIVSKHLVRSDNQCQNSHAIVSSHTALGMTATNSGNTVAEEDALKLVSQAREFAFRDEYGLEDSSEYDQHYHSVSDELAEIEECKYWLRKMIDVQSGCAAGTLAGKDVCENQDEAAVVVARLRRKIETHEKRVTSWTKSTESLVPTIATELIAVALLAVVGIFWTTLDVSQRHDDIGSMQNYQEWLGIIKDKGYFNFNA